VQLLRPVLLRAQVAERLMGAVQGGCGELRGLTWADVDFEEGQVSVRRTLEESSAGLTFKEPKTARGARNPRPAGDHR
jgi:integrase